MEIVINQSLLAQTVANAYECYFGWMIPLKQFTEKRFSCTRGPYEQYHVLGMLHLTRL